VDQFGDLVGREQQDLARLDDGAFGEGRLAKKQAELTGVLPPRQRSTPPDRVPRGPFPS
jgi:hypothetical protein